MGKDSQTKNDQNLIGNDSFLHFLQHSKIVFHFPIKMCSLFFEHVSDRNIIYFFLHFKFILFFILDLLIHSETTFYNISYKERIKQNGKIRSIMQNGKLGRIKQKLKSMKKSLKLLRVKWKSSIIN
jgi:hypothetical protein